MAGHDKTEKATPKRRKEARQKGQVARSTEMSESVRKDVLESLDREIARIEAEK